jgi:hypothetical protein
MAAVIRSPKVNVLGFRYESRALGPGKLCLPPQTVVHDGISYGDRETLRVPRVAQGLKGVK